MPADFGPVEQGALKPQNLTLNPKSVNHAGISNLELKTSPLVVPTTGLIEKTSTIPRVYKPTYKCWLSRTNLQVHYGPWRSL